MNVTQPQAPTISNGQIMQASGAGLQLFGLDTTLIPGNLRRQVAVLEAVLQGIATGNLQVVSTQPQQVESKLQEGADSKPKDDISDLTGEEKQDGRDTDTPPA